MRIIDAHCHLFDEPGYLDKFLSTMDEYGIEKCCLSGLGKLFGFAGNEDVKAAYSAHPDRIIGAVFIRPGLDEPRKIKQAYQEGFEDMERRVPDISKIKKLVGYENTCDLNTILANVIEYERKRAS